MFLFLNCHTWSLEPNAHIFSTILNSPPAFTCQDLPKSPGHPHGILFLGGHRFQVDLFTHYPFPGCAWLPEVPQRIAWSQVITTQDQEATRQRQNRKDLLQPSLLPREGWEKSWQESISPKTSLPSSILHPSRERQRGTQIVGLCSSGLPQLLHLTLCDFGHTT